MTFGRIIRQAREVRRLTQEQAAELVCISTRCYQSLEYDYSEPRMTIFLRLVFLFDLDLELLRDCVISNDA